MSKSAAAKEFASETIGRVAGYWNSRPCNIRHSPLPVGTREYFDQVEARKYFVEPHIPAFACFDEWKGKRVLEIGCGIGRMALPLTQYLDGPMASYTGFDVVAEGIDWCRENISSAYADFRFHHLDFNNQLYNPNGALSETSDLPFADASADFIFMTSVVTHLDPAFTDFYFREAARLLAPGGRLFLTAFVLDASNRRLVEAKKARPAFHLEGEGPAYIADRAHPMAAVAYENDWLLSTAKARGLQLSRPIAFGHWSGRSAENYQDICVFQHAKPALPGRKPA